MIVGIAGKLLAMLPRSNLPWGMQVMATTRIAPGKKGAVIPGPFWGQLHIKGKGKG